MAFTLVHVSDIHFGRIAQPDVVDQLVADVNACGPGLVAISGDLTQRARPAQFEAASDMVARFDAPVLVVPGNHDVYAWWHRPLLRMARPLRRYRRFFGHAMAPFVDDGVAVLGLGSAFGWTVKGGYVSPGTAERVQAFFADVPDEAFRVLVVHHPLMRLPGLKRHGFVWYARRTLKAAVAARVDLILCGHLHLTRTHRLRAESGRPGPVLALAGTATSDRGRDGDGTINAYNVIEVAEERFVLTVRQHDPSARAFVPVAATTFDRNRALRA